MTMFEPALRICAWIEELAPVPIATMTMTAATPMIMPSAVSAVRIAFLRRAFKATTSVIQMDMMNLRDAPVFDGAVVQRDAVTERDDARAVLGDVGLVRHEHDRDAALHVEPLKDAHHLDAGLAIEVARRLVGEQQRRPIYERARNRDALLLAAGELIGMVIEPFAQTNRRQRFGRTLAPLGRVNTARVEQRQLDVLEGGGARQQVKALEHEPDFRVADARQLARTELRHVLAVEKVLSARRPIEAAEQVHERGLAGARRTGERDELAGRDVERDPTERRHLHFADVVDLRQLPRGDDGVHRPAPPRAPPAPAAPAPRFPAPPPRRPNGMSGDVLVCCAAAPGSDIAVMT